MKKSRLVGAVCACICVIISNAANSALLPRLPDGSGGFQAYYDDSLGITWLTDANLAASVSFGAGGIQPNGRMKYANAENWIIGMNTDNGTGWLGFNNWQIAESGWMSNLFFNTLGNTVDGICNTSDGLPNLCLDNRGPFTNLNPVGYWGDSPGTGSFATRFHFGVGNIQTEPKTDSSFILFPVIVGDIAPVPIPAAVWLFGSGLLGLIGMMRCKVT